ncbi:hypothetical protein HON59_02460 [bacterium]|jgi:hypothetical protein|nr:hypothetical protein [bacterium]MBT3729933.1 hypothetical protein [bacterium]MBT4894899.1 hypothetical protein [bacterium]
MKVIEALLEQLIGADQCGGKTMALDISIDATSACSSITRVSTCGADITKIVFKPPLPLDEALLKAHRYEDKGEFTSGN